MTPLKSRPRRLRTREEIRRLVRETRLEPADLVMPLFVAEGLREPRPVRSMPGISQLSVENAVQVSAEAYKLGLGGVILFGIPIKKDTRGSQAYARDGIVQRAVGEIRETVPDLVVITDVCLCEYMSHGHCGVMRNPPRSPLSLRGEGNSLHPPLKVRGGGGGYEIDNDATLELLAVTALSHVEAGADMVAPSAMMDGQVASVRRILDEAGHTETPILSYAVKFASAFYGPFREAAESPPKFGDRKSYQMDPANAREALREARLDIQEGADIVMVKPALPYLDILSRLRETTDVPLAAYHVSGEYAQIKAAAANGWIDERSVVLEQLTAIKRAGADFILTYFAKDVAGWLSGS